jgi:hypothetical protein
MREAQLMNLRKMIVELQAEKIRLDEAIVALERLSHSISKRRGRPSRWLNQAIVQASAGMNSSSQPGDPIHKVSQPN